MNQQMPLWDDSRASLIGQGTWMMESHPRAQAVAALRTGIDAGMTLIDTAEMYGSGRAEEIVGEAIEGRRDQVFLVSKVLPSNASFDGTQRACERSLRRLGVDQIDLYLLHWSGSHPIRDTVRGLTALVEEEMVRFIGVSNLDVEELEAALAATTHAPIVCNQVLYHLGDRGIERRLMPFCERNGVTVMGYSPFGHEGFFREGSKDGQVLARVAARHHATMRQVVLAFLTREGVPAIPKSGNVDHVRENAKRVTLTAEDLVEIDRAFPKPQRDVPLGMI